ncbi:hypothetical protein WJX84_002609 [Apatococcus fuscideae]|uniref:Uncharacterized protein n=1 Tax=Apatococcus fuscideae TaxID=2026836 RepID=A0AAW1RWT0_9CHLO
MNLQLCSLVSGSKATAVQTLRRGAPVLSRRTHRSSCVAVRAADGPPETSSGNDSYSKIEAPVRGTIPDGGIPVSDRDVGLGDLNEVLKSKSDNPDKSVGAFNLGDAFRFTGAVPEVANSRLAMLGIVAAMGAELYSGQNVFSQIKSAPIPIALTFLTLIVATAVPIFRGTPRRGTALFSSDAELINGRFAMVGFFFLVLSTSLTGKFFPLLPAHSNTPNIITSAPSYPHTVSTSQSPAAVKPAPELK